MELYPVVLEHAAAFVGETPWAVSRDADLLYRAHREAWSFYGHAPVVCGIDVYHLEVEAWGAQVGEPVDGGMPTIGFALLDEVCELADLPALDLHRDGRLPLTLAAARRLRRAGGAVRGPMAGPVSLAAGLLGFETLLFAMLDDRDAVGEALEALAHRQARLAAAWRAEGLEPVLYESAGGPPLVAPADFRTLVAPALRIVFAEAPMPCVLGGDTASVADALLATGPSAVLCPAETDQAAFLETAAAWPDCAVRINLPAADLAAGDRDRAVAAIDRAAALAGGRAGVSLGTGVLAVEADPDFVRDLIAYAAGVDGAPRA